MRHVPADVCARSPPATFPRSPHRDPALGSVARHRSRAWRVCGRQASGRGKAPRQSLRSWPSPRTGRELALHQVPCAAEMILFCGFVRGWTAVCSGGISHRRVNSIRRELQG
jgi:hypothetical protein